MNFCIAVLASTNGTSLKAILDEMVEGKLPGVELVRVVSDRECGALDKALAAGVEAMQLDPSGLSREDFDAKLAAVVGGVDLVCLIGYMRILSPVFVKAFAGKIINIHPSLLPKYGGKGWYGMKVHEAVVANGDTETGMTIHYVDEGVDSGAHVLQRSVAVLPEDTPETVKSKVQELEKVAYPEAIRLLQQQAMLS